MTSRAQARSTLRSNIGLVVHWAGIVLAAVGTLSAVMSLALFEGAERYEAAAGWAAFAVISYLVGRFARRLLSR